MFLCGPCMARGKETVQRGNQDRWAGVGVGGVEDAWSLICLSHSEETDMLL